MTKSKINYAGYSHEEYLKTKAKQKQNKETDLLMFKKLTDILKEQNVLLPEEVKKWITSKIYTKRSNVEQLIALMFDTSTPSIGSKCTLLDAFNKTMKGENAIQRAVNIFNDKYSNIKIVKHLQDNLLYSYYEVVSTDTEVFDNEKI